VYITGAILLGFNAFLLFALVNSGSPALLIIGFAISLSLHALMYGPMGAFLAELFGTSRRYTGASLGYQIASVLGGGLAPLIATSILAASGGAPNSFYVAVYMLATCLLSALAAFYARETHRRDLALDE
jgi:hypothetical protein